MIEMVKMKAKKIKSFLKQKNGDVSFSDVIWKVLIAAVIGAILILVMKSVMPDLFENIMDKIEEGITGIEIT